MAYVVSKEDITSYGPHARIRSVDCGAWMGDDLIVEELIAGQWVERGKHNTMSDDYAYTNAGSLANTIRSRRDKARVA